MKHVSEIVDPAIRRMGVRRRVHDARIESVLAEVLGPPLSSLCHAVSLRRGVLLIATAHGGLAQQLQLDSERLIATLNTALGTDAIQRLAFRPLATASGAGT